jgi:peptidyl-prolyl cis-trans isomerase SurA
MIVFACLAAMVLLVAVACNGPKGGPGVMATVNGHKITREELDKYYKNQTADAPQAISEEQADNLRLNILHGMIDNEILMQRAEKLGLIATDDEVNAKISEAKAPYTQEEWHKQLKQRGITLDDVKREFRQQVTIQKVLNREVVSKINITDDDIKAYYNQHKAEFNFIETQYRLAQIVVTASPNPQLKIPDKAQNDQEAKRKIQMIYNRLESGEDFGSVATKYSETPDAAQNGGDLGFIPESSLKNDKVTFDVISKLRPGQSTPIMPVYDPGSRQIAGYRIVRLIGKEPAGQRELSDPRVQQAIREQLRDRREQLLKAAYYDVIHDEAKIENFFAEDILKKAGSNGK